MTLLGLTAEELRQQIDSELAANPALELVEERRCPTCGHMLPMRGSCPVCSRPQTASPDEPIVFISPREDFYSGSSASREDLPEDNYSPSVEDLPTFVLRQIACELSPEDRPVAAFLLTHLTEDGLLDVSLLEVARYFHTTLARIESIISLIQHAEPVGVGSVTPQDAMLVQLEVLAETVPVPELAAEAIRECMDILSHRQYADLAHALKISARQAKEIAHFISENLNPFPARSHWGDVRQTAPLTQVYHNPDILIYHLNDTPENPLVVEIIMPLMGTLRVNPLFRQSIRQADPDKIVDWKSDLDRASLFVKCIQQRNHTIQRLMQKLVTYQTNFILRGEAQLKPLTRASIAVQLGVHESTISRAVSSKAVQLPNGRIIPMSMFFDRSLNVRTALKNIIETESRPLSDTELAQMLSKIGYSVARRTVAKYRAMEGILPAHLRTNHSTVAA
jgi:RNA polymerase sigma-54 factor